MGDLGAILTGVVCGILAGVPTSALILVMLWSRDCRRAQPRHWIVVDGMEVWDGR